MRCTSSGLLSNWAPSRACLVQMRAAYAVNSSSKTTTCEQHFAGSSSITKRTSPCGWRTPCNCSGTCAVPTQKHAERSRRFSMVGASAPTVLRASLLNGAAIAATMNGDTDGGQQLNEQALAIARNTGNRVIAGHVLQSLANGAELRGDFTKARAYTEDALTNYRCTGDRLRET